MTALGTPQAKRAGLGRQPRPQAYAMEAPDGRDALSVARCAAPERARERPGLGQGSASHLPEPTGQTGQTGQTGPDDHVD